EKISPKSNRIFRNQKDLTLPNANFSIKPAFTGMVICQQTRLLIGFRVEQIEHFFQVFPCFQNFYNFLKTLNLNYFFRFDLEIFVFAYCFSQTKIKGLATPSLPIKPST
ncbi:hypothetical protein MM716_35185, partial [Klebsiella pneumoniae]|nr:hypothetical protein [Klebsiella pneumoniae]